MMSKKLLLLLIVILMILVFSWIIMQSLTTTPSIEPANIPDINDRPNILNGYAVYTSAEDIFRIQYRKEWIFSGPSRGEYGCSYYSTNLITIAVCPKPRATTNATIFELFAKALYSDSMKNVKLVSEDFPLYKKYSFSGSYPWNNNSTHYQTTGIIALYNGKMYIIEYRNNPSQFDKSLEQANIILETFEAIKSDASSMCYCSYCSKDCMSANRKSTEECPPIPQEDSKCARGYCAYENGKCQAKPLPKWTNPVNL